jgi:hypothetical protein
MEISLIQIGIEIALLNKKFWEEVIALFPITRYIPRRKRHLQQFSVAAGTFPPSRYLAATRR